MHDCICYAMLIIREMCFKLKKNSVDVCTRILILQSKTDNLHTLKSLTSTHKSAHLADVAFSQQCSFGRSTILVMPSWYVLTPCFRKHWYRGSCKYRMED